ncbi:MAG: ABC transporter ATP-binding protein [Rhizobiaceae bacterium]
MPSLVLERVSKRFGGITAVSDVSFEVPEAGITGLIGPNGAGKTTVVNLITGMYKLTSGEIRLGGRNVGSAQPHEVARLGISRTFQNIRLLPEASVLDNVIIGFHRHEKASIAAGMFGFNASLSEIREFRERARALLDRFHMARFAEHPAGYLAYGHQRRVEMMRAVAMNPAILLLDEPVAGMNDVEAGELGDVFQELASSGMGLLLIEHNIRFVTKLCQNVHVLDTGRTIAAGPPSVVMHDPVVVTAYLGTA